MTAVTKGAGKGRAAENTAKDAAKNTAKDALEYEGRLAEGAPAELVMFRARTFNEILTRPQSDRVELRAGRPIDRTLPDYRELDHLMGTP